MSARADLQEIAEKLAAMLPRFTKSQSGIYMADADEPDFTQLITEAKVIFDEEFGRANDFSMNIVQAANTGVSNISGSPSYHSVQQVVAFIRAGINQLDRRRRQSAEGARDIPAADRYVALNDNQRGEVESTLREIKEETRGANEVEEEHRLIALSEIAAFEATILQPRVASDLIQRFIDTVVGWIKRTFTAATVQEVAQRLIGALLKLLAG